MSNPICRINEGVPSGVDLGFEIQFGRIISTCDMVYTVSRDASCVSQSDHPSAVSREEDVPPGRGRLGFGLAMVEERLGARGAAGLSQLACKITD
jgi:hypothetical protein